MAKISYIEYQDIISYLQAGHSKEDELSFLESKGISSQAVISSLTDLVSMGGKHLNSMDKLFEQEQELSFEEVIEYTRKIDKFLETHNFARPFLVKAFPEESIEDFDQKRWATLTKLQPFKGKSDEELTMALKMAFLYGVFENDEAAANRLHELGNMMNGKALADLEMFKNLQMEYNPQFLDFIRNNIEALQGLNLAQIQEKWQAISNCIDIKSPENVQRYLQISEEKSGNDFETYMAYHNIPASKMEKYRVIYEQMLGRTETSLPTVSGKVDKGFSYEMLDFSDINVMRFGEKVKCCQRLGNVAETSMINSAIEATSRVIMIKDEKGKPVAGSFVTHRIDKDGRSYVCFDSIEVNAAKLPVKAVAFSKTMKRLDKLVKKGIIADAKLETIEAYFEQHPDQTDIRKKDLEALRVNQKIKDAYRAAKDDLIREDEIKRTEQVEKGEITAEEKEHLLIKNGLITIGRNPVSMYLGDLEKVDKKDQEMLPALRKDRSIYKKAHKTTLSEVTRKVVRGMSYGAFGLGAAMVVTGAPVAGIAFGAWGVYANTKLKRKKVNHTYSDAFEQRVLEDGRKRSDVEKIHDKDALEQLQEKLIYSKYERVSKPIKIAELTPEQRKDFRRLREAAGREDFTEQDQDRYIIGNGHNWSAVLTRDGENVTVNDISMLNSFGFGKKQAMLADAQVELMSTLQAIAEKSDGITFETGDKKIDRYLGRRVVAETKEPTAPTRAQEVKREEVEH
ncbi:MAG: hypothetical protein IJO08_03290 [Clostridia bacterium]|nr:hypothetical protein [Clostridia bacterium]